jgi:hypothetical protein
VYDAHGCVALSEVNDSCSGVRAVSGPEVRGKQCCYAICRGPVPPCGRPLVDAGGAPRVAPTAARSDWKADLGPAVPQRSRDEWLADAAMEHASVASFARFSLELLAIGAPSSFVEEAHRAALDEIEHARLCFALAGVHAPERGPVGPGALDLSGIVLRSRLADVAAAAAEEGCCGETMGALVAAHERDRATDDTARAALARIAEDEARHAELAWRFVAWALATGDDEVRSAVASAFERGVAGLGTSDLARAARSRCIVPCKEQLDASPRPSA